MAGCPNPFDVLRMRVEDLGPQLYLRASHRTMEVAMTPRSEYPHGAGMSRTAFTIGRSEPSSDEEAWPLMTTINTAAPTCTTGGSGCNNTWNQAYVGYHELNYGPEAFSLVGPDICQTELIQHWNSTDFWEKYYQALEKRNMRSLENRLRNISMNFVPHAGAVQNFSWGDPLAFNVANLSKCNSNSIVIAPDSVYLNDLPAPTGSGATLNYGELTQEILDATAVTLIQETAVQPDDNGWITMGPGGPLFLLEIGMEASQRIVLNNADFRLDIRSAWDTLEDANPLLRRFGATLVLKNYRHIVIATPPRWDWVTTGDDGQPIAANHTYTEPNSGIVYPNTTTPVYGGGCWVRRPVYLNSQLSKYATKGRVPILNPTWVDAEYEGARVLNPWVFTEEVIRPLGAVGNMTWGPQNYMGEWQFVTGIDAYAGIDGCTIPTGGDPLHKRGRHFAEYLHAAKPIFPEYGRFIMFHRCKAQTTIARCQYD